MADHDQHERRIQIETLYGTAEGSLPLSSLLRTLDHLNRPGMFLTLHDARVPSGAWPFSAGTVLLNKDAVLYAAELSAPPLSVGDFGRFTRAGVRLTVGQYELQGFVHVPPGGVALKAIDQSTHPFVAVTSVLISGPRPEFMAPFVAVNRRHIGGAQELQDMHVAAPVASAAAR